MTHKKKKIHIITIAREMPKTKGKKHVPVNLSENIQTAT